MSQENVEVARRLYPLGVDLVATFADREGFKAMWGVFESLMQPDFETVSAPGQIPLSGAGADDPSRPIFYGMDGFVSSFRDWLSAWQSWVVTATEFIDVDETRVLVLLDVRARSMTHQVEIPIEGANLLTFSDGRLGRLEIFFDRAQAREAAGLKD